MRKPYLLAITIGFFVILASGISGCTKRVDAVDNNEILETPFTVFFADISGAVYSSNDGATINKEIFEADRYQVKAICTSYDNILFAKQNLYISTNNGTSFNHSDDFIASYPGIACDGYAFDLNQSMIINIADWNYVYVCNDNQDPNNFIGLSYNLYAGVQGDVSNGQLGNWYLERPDTIGYIGLYGSTPGDINTIRITSLTLLPNGLLFGYDAHSNRCFYRTKNVLWNESTANPDPADYPGIGDPHNNGGTPLPHRDIFVAPGASVDTTARYTVGHYNNEIIAIDQINCGNNGAYFSDDSGRNWKQFSGVPGNPLLCVASPFEEECLIGTQGAGLYILNNNTHTWQADNQGLPQNVTVRSIVGKQQIYKNGRVAKFIFLATDQGIYQSVDGGNNWTLARAGSFTAIF